MCFIRIMDSDYLLFAFRVRASIMASFKPAESLLAESEKERECGASVWPDAGLMLAECTPFTACAAALFPIGYMHCCPAI